MCTIMHTCIYHIYGYIYISANSRRSMLNFIWLNAPDFPDSWLQAWFEREIRMTSSITAAALCEPDKNESHADLTSDSIRILEASLKQRQTMRNCCFSKPLWEIASQLAKWRPQFPRWRELGFRLSKWGYLDLIQQSLVSFIPKRSSSQARCIGVWHRPRTLLIEVGAIHCTFPLVNTQMQ